MAAGAARALPSDVRSTRRYTAAARRPVGSASSDPAGWVVAGALVVVGAAVGAEVAGGAVGAGVGGTTVTVVVFVIAELFVGGTGMDTVGVAAAVRVPCCVGVDDAVDPCVLVAVVAPVIVAMFEAVSVDVGTGT